MADGVVSSWVNLPGSAVFGKFVGRQFSMAFPHASKYLFGKGVWVTNNLGSQR